VKKYKIFEKNLPWPHSGSRTAAKVLVIQKGRRPNILVKKFLEINSEKNPVIFPLDKKNPDPRARAIGHAAPTAAPCATTPTL